MQPSRRCASCLGLGTPVRVLIAIAAGLTVVETRDLINTNIQCEIATHWYRCFKLFALFLALFLRGDGIFSLEPSSAKQYPILKVAFVLGSGGLTLSEIPKLIEVGLECELATRNIRFVTMTMLIMAFLLLVTNGHQPVSTTQKGKSGEDSHSDEERGEMHSRDPEPSVKVRRTVQSGLSFTSDPFEIGNADLRKEDFDSAEIHFRRALEERKKDFGPAHRSVSIVLKKLARALDEKGGYDEAEKLYRQALEIDVNNFGPSHSQVAAALGGLADVLDTKGEYDEAEKLLRQALEIEVNTFGPNHSEVAVTLNSLANVLIEKGEYNDSEKLYRHALQIYVDTFGTNHCDVATALHGLAEATSKKGEYDEAEKLFRQVVEIQRNLVDSDQLDYAKNQTHLRINQSSLACVLREKCDYDEAQKILLETSAYFAKVRGRNHPYYAIVLSNLASVLDKKGDYGEAEKLYREALAVFDKTFGPSHPIIAFNLTRLGDTLRDKGELREAKASLERALSIYERRASFTYRYGEALLAMGKLLQVSGDSIEAQAYGNRGVGVLVDKLGPKHPVTLNAVGWLESVGR